MHEDGSQGSCEVFLQLQNKERLQLQSVEKSNRRITMHPDLNDYDCWADEIELDEEPKRFLSRAADIDSCEEEFKCWVSL